MGCDVCRRCANTFLREALCQFVVVVGAPNQVCCCCCCWCTKPGLLLLLLLVQQFCRERGLHAMLTFIGSDDMCSSCKWDCSHTGVHLLPRITSGGAGVQFSDDYSSDIMAWPQNTQPSVIYLLMSAVIHHLVCFL